MMKRKFSGLLTISIATAIVISCQSVDVNKVDKSRYDVKNVCILQNPDVIVEDFLPALQVVLEQRGIASKVLPKEDTTCAYRLIYTANQAWDMAMYIRYISLILYKGDSEVGRGTYSAGMWFGKFGSVDEKLRIVTDRLLADFSQRPK